MSTSEQRKRALFVFGTRPEAIKLAPLVLHMKNHSKTFSPIVCVTSQHREMLDQVLRVFEITPDFDLDIMLHNQNLSDLTSRILTKLNEVVSKVSPDWIIVQGDTTTTFVASLVGFYHRMRVAHVEAGLRTGDKANPFPEEINRRLATALSDLHFAPTPKSRENLLREHVLEELIHVTGNTVIDALFLALKKPGPVADYLPSDKNRRVILVTAHRRESFGEPFLQICRAIKSLADRNEDIEIIFPVHLNPNVQEPVRKILSKTPRVRLIEPVEYLPFVKLMERSYFVMTDSGGIQEEAPSLGKPVLVMRETTERPEGVEAGTVKLVGTDENRIEREAQNLLDNPSAYEEMKRKVNPYGDGKSSSRILSILEAQ